MNDEIVQVKFSFPIPPNKWIAQFSNSFSDVHFNMLSMLLLSKTQGSGLFQVRGKNRDTFWTAFCEFYDPAQFTLIFRDKNSLLINILFEDPWVISTLMEAQQFIVQFPIGIRKGVVSMELIAPRSKVDLIFTNPDWKEVNISVRKITNYTPESLLTQRQLHILHLALENGYFDIPRKKSLSDLAKDLHISATALSENLRRINKKLAQNYLDFCFE